MATKCPKCHTENPETSLFCSGCGTKLEAAGEFSLFKTKSIQAPLGKLSAGSPFAGRYQIIEELGQGGMGVVYKAEDTRLKRPVALKFLPEALSRDRRALERFEREAQAASALNHPHICTVHDIDEADGQPFIAMELLEGASLRSRIQGRPLPIREILDLGVQLADALDAAHAKGILHRDIKPENIFITPRGTAKLLDFGIAKLVAEQTNEKIPTITFPQWATAPGMAVGTVAYMSPEQVRGEPLDVRTDLFSFGIVLYEMVTGVKPFGGATSGAVCTEIQTKTPTAPVRLNPDVPGELERIINKALEKEARLRYQSAKDLLVDLERLRCSLASGMQMPGSRPAEQASIAVLPFENLSPDPDNAFFADGLTEELIADLSKVQSLRVISRTSAMMYKGVKKSAPVIAQELGVRYVLEGSVRRAGNSLRITAQLIDSSTDAHLWAEKYTGTLEDVFELQEKLSQRIVEGLRVKLTPDDVRRLAAHVTADPRVYEVWLRIRQEGWKLTREGIEKAIQLTAQALKTFGDHALLHAADGVCSYLAYDFGFSHDEETLARVEGSASRAINLNPDLALGWYVKGLGRYKRGDMLGFVTNLRHSVRLERNSEALFFLAFALAEIGRMDEARSFAEESLERDPMTYTTSLCGSAVDLFDGKFDAALTRFRDSQGMADVAFSQWWLGQAFAYAGKKDEAVSAFERGSRSGQELLSKFCEMGARSFKDERENVLAWYKSEEGMRQSACSDETFPRFLAMCLAQIKEYDLALQWLERAIQWGFLNYQFLSEHDRFLKPLRDDPRFKALMDRAREKQRAFEV